MSSQATRNPLPRGLEASCLLRAGADATGECGQVEPGHDVVEVRAFRRQSQTDQRGYRDDRLSSGTTIADAITAVDQAAPPDYFLINCSHPTHIERGLGDDGPWRHRIAGIRANASTKSHAELDEAEQLDEGDIDLLVAGQARLTQNLPALSILGGCCGTDHRHVAALWDGQGPGSGLAP